MSLHVCPAEQPGGLIVRPRFENPLEQFAAPWRAVASSGGRGPTEIDRSQWIGKAFATRRIELQPPLQRLGNSLGIVELGADGPQQEPSPGFPIRLARKPLRDLLGREISADLEEQTTEEVEGFRVIRVPRSTRLQGLDCRFRLARPTPGPGRRGRNPQASMSTTRIRP